MTTELHGSLRPIKDQIDANKTVKRGDIFAALYLCDIQKLNKEEQIRLLVADVYNQKLTEKLLGDLDSYGV